MKKKRHLLTRNGVCYDLPKSPYHITFDDVTYYFSSKNHLEKFTEKIYQLRDELAYSLNARFSMKINAPIISDICLYKNVETRGFHIECKGEIYSCKKDIKLDGLVMTAKN